MSDNTPVNVPKIHILHMCHLLTYFIIYLSVISDLTDCKNTYENQP